MTVRSWENFDEALDEIQAGVSHGLRTAAQTELEKSEDAYDAERDVLGRPWKPLAPSTIAAKGHDTILVDSGSMRDSGFVSEVGGEIVKVGYSDWKTALHEFGREDLPRRPIVEPMRIDLKENVLLPTVAESVEESLDGLHVTSTVRQR